jgi:hypothetical protein
LFKELLSLILKVLGQRCDRLTQFSILLLEFIRSKGVKHIFRLQLGVLGHLSQELLLLILEKLDLNLVCLEVDLLGLNKLFKLLDLALVGCNLVNHLLYLLLLICEALG